jgi:hypothetical protein
VNSVSRTLALALALLPSTLAAQTVSPTTPAHPGLPWSLGVAIPQGQLIRYIYVPPQPVTLVYLVTGPPDSPPALEPAPPGAEGEAKPAAPPPDQAATPESPGTARVVQQQVTVPAYYVRETTVGFLYPERWTVEQSGPNVYRWRQLPAQFVPK